MVQSASRSNASWREFGRRWDWGTPLSRKESKKAKKKRLRGVSGNKKRIKKRNKAYEQLSLQGCNITLRDAEAYGDKMLTKRENTVRVGLQNMQLLPESAKHYKSRQSIDHIHQGEYDLWLMNEIGLYWPKLDAGDQWFERVLGKLHDSYSIFAHNNQEHESTDKIQYGGVGLVASSEIKHRIIDQGKDPTGLGRWVWIRIQGKEGHTTRIASAYRPCESDGAGSVFRQHQRVLSATGDHRHPLDAFCDDLSAEIINWKLDGDHLVIGMDANEDVRTGEINTSFRNLGLRDAILDLHAGSSPPATHNRNQNRTPIDGLWTTPGLHVTFGGYGAFGDGCPSDHRSLWIDINYSSIFGSALEPLRHPTARKLKTNDPRLVHKYHNGVKTRMFKSGFFKRMTAFKHRYKSGLLSRPTMITEYNLLHAEDTDLRVEAEDNLRKLRMGGVPWSPRLQALREEIELWRMIVKRRKRIKISLSRIRRFIKKTGIGHALTHDLDSAHSHLNLAYKAYKAGRKNASVWRNDFLHNLAKAKAEQKGTDAKLEEHQLIRIERQRRQARNVKRMTGKLNRGRVTQVFYTNDANERVVCDSQASMVRACITENETRFSQAESTPPMISPLYDILGKYGETIEAQEILSGTFEFPVEIDRYAKELLEELRTPSIVLAKGPVTLELTLPEHVLGWKRQKEATASEPTGLAFSHYKASAQDPMLAEIDRFMRNLPYREGFSPDAWQFITDVEILKKSGVFDIEKMRTIQLMHSAFNMNNKKLGRDMMYFAESCKILAPEQFGSRKNHQSILAALNKRLTMDVLRQRRQAGALCSNDAKSCYDRIVHNVAALSMRRMGIPAEPVASMFLTLQQSQHVISTAFGVSKESYGRGRRIPLQGVGQGNGAGPAIWAVISTVIINMMRTAGHGLHIVSALSCILISFVCYAFVDDTDVVHASPSPLSTGEDVLADMQTVVDRWEGGLRATGGALVPSKSHWYLIDFVWTGTKWRYRTKVELPGDVSVLDKDGIRTVLDRHDPATATETLGVWQAMDGNNSAEIRVLRKKTEAFAESMRTGFLSKADAWYALNSSFLKTLEYPMVATTISQKSWEYIMSPILKVALPRSGIARNFPRAVLYGPKSLQGFGIIHPWYHQELLHLITCVQQAAHVSISGSLISTSLEQLRLEAGLSGFLTDHSYKTVHQTLTSSWLQDLWSFCGRFKIELHDSAGKLVLSRRQDQFLMEAFISSDYSGRDLKRLNECRMYLQVTTLADIVDAGGLLISLLSWEGRRDHRTGFYYEWPRSPPSLSRDHWELWRQALQKSFGLRSRTLTTPLGKWTRAPPSLWQWHYSPQEDRIYAKEGLLWRVYPRSLSRTSPRRGGCRYLRSDTFVPVPPEDLRLASVIQQGLHYICTSTCDLFGRDCPAPPLHHKKVCSLDFERERTLLPAADQWAIAQISLPDGGVGLARSIVQGSAIAVSDGSFKDGRGTAGFILEDPDNPNDESRAIGVNTVPGSLEDHSAYRSEISGVSGIVSTTECICAAHGVTDGTIEVGLDGDQAMKAISGDWLLSADHPDFDLLQDLRAKIARSPLTWKFRWIKGHQDATTLFSDLDRWGQLNVICDGLAKAFWNHCALTSAWLPNQTFGDENWSVWIEGKKLSYLNKQQLYAYTFSARTTAYWHRKHSLPPELITSIHWDACATAMSKLPFGKKRWLLKHATGFCGVGKMELRRGNQDHDECPRCRQSEDVVHVLTCRGTGADLAFTTSLQKLDAHMRQIKTAPEIRQVVLKRIRHWRLHQHHVPMTAAVPDEFGLRDAVSAQDAIGWYNFLLGRLSKKWSDVQARYLESIQSRSSGRRWTIAILEKIWDISWDMWEQRNGIAHDPSHHRRLAQLQEMQRRVQVIFSEGSEGLLPRDRRLFSKGVERLTDGSETDMQQWITSILLARERADSATADSAASLRAQRAAFKRWFESG